MDVRYLDRYYSRNEWSKLTKKACNAESFRLALGNDKLSEKFKNFSESGIVLTGFEENGPKRLSDFPVYFYRGKALDIKDRTAAIVGTRKPTPEGVTTAVKTARLLASSGYRIISDLSTGISSCVQNDVAVNYGGGIAVLPSPLGTIYPPYHSDLTDKIVSSKGTIVWLLPPMKNRRIFASDFALANTFIASVSDLVVFIEGTLKSGTKSLIEYSADSGKEILVWKSGAEKPQSEFSDALIECGCRYFKNTEEFKLAAGIEATENSSLNENLTEEENNLIGCAEREISLPLLVEKSGLSAQKALTIISDLEIRGLLEKTPCGNIISAVR
ncbi:DNA-processing protein DprA [candidate division WOR-3 bacterium]|nr:DNA-processing protein DprA [candidate division WOR-3 bacterium]